MVWQLQNVGGVAGLIDKCKRYQIDGVFLKGADGDSQWTSQFNASVVSQLHAAGIGCIGWHYVYGGPGGGAPSWSSVAGEIAAAKYILSTGADGYLFDDEVELDNKPSVVVQYGQALRAAYPYASIGYNPYPFPSSAPTQPWWEFNNFCDYCMPQLYQGQDGLGTPAEALAKMQADFDHWSPIWAARPGGRAAIPLCIDWQGASWAGATIPDSDIADAARVSVGKYPCISYWDMDSLTAGEWAGVAQAAAIWHGTSTGGSGMGFTIGTGMQAELAAHPEYGAAAANETYRGNGDAYLFTTSGMCLEWIKAAQTVQPGCDVVQAAIADRDSQIVALQHQVTALQAQVADLTAKLAAVQPAPVDPAMQARANAFEAIKAALAIA